ncbi:ABC transporter substrate-binding protein [Ornithinibacillus gellani]|uniref:ABC transporter substrate-binding protein n=1 Tax=Ornithinibacillus gellani TaxID=2293253 RepID=UPI000F46D504|nr:ABC transporter substrate-binding protein [Ornithinibacillus gellani]TQS76566.1 ABC transporter substrate-binding protein [Ornithinibacillus gellani]
MKKIAVLCIGLVALVLAACSGSSSDGEIDKIVFADAGWDSIRVHNHVAQTIVEEGFGYKTDVTAGSTAATIQGLREGDINVYMEVWTDNIKEVYEEAIDAGDIEKLSTNFDDNNQGLYVPTYVIEGDPERGIEPMAPDLKTVEDLKKYPEVFEDPEDPGRGRVINAPSGWEVADAIDEKFKTYGLDETLNNFMPGSDSAAVADLVAAYKAGKGWVGYYWSPTAITAKYDLTLLEEPEFDLDTWNETKGTEFPPNDVVVAVHKDMPDQAPEVVEFLKNYETSSELTEEALAYMEDNDASAEEAAEWWMKEHEDLWTAWLDEDIAKKVKDALK